MVSHGVGVRKLRTPTTKPTCYLAFFRQFYSDLSKALTTQERERSRASASTGQVIPPPAVAMPCIANVMAGNAESNYS